MGDIADRLGSRRVALILLLWATAAVLIATQAAVLHTAYTNNIAYYRGLVGRPRFPAEWWRLAGTFVPLVLIGAALWLQRKLPRGWPRKLSKAALALFLPAAVLALLVAALAGPSALDDVHLPSGKRFVLAPEPVLTDAVYTLYEATGPFGAWWVQAADLDYSEDGRFTGGERLVLSPDSRWLLVARAGVWTDCFRLVHEQPVGCGVQLGAVWFMPTYDAEMRARSAEIEKLTGMHPPT